MIDRPCWYCQHFGGIEASGAHCYCTHPTCSRVQANPARGCCSWSRVPGVDDDGWRPLAYRPAAVGVAWRDLMPVLG